METSIENSGRNSMVKTRELNDFVDISDVKMPPGLPKFNFYRKLNYYEVAVSLFETCNLNCKFCFQSHNKPIDYDKILGYPDKIIDTLSDDLKRYSPKILLMKVWGGELFFDRLPDETFDVYRTFYRKFKERFNKEFPDIEFKINWLSNGIWANRDRVLQLLKDTEASISFSYDSVYRYSNEKQKEIWKETFWYFYDRKLIDFIAITLTRPNMEAIRNGDEVIDMLPPDVQIDTNYYAANKDWEKYIPSDDDMFLFYKWCIDNKKFNMTIIESLVRHMIPEEEKYVPKWCDCKGTRQCYDGIPTSDCVKIASSLDRKEFYGKYDKYADESNFTEIKNSLGLIKLGCQYCEHYKTCPQTCWVTVIFSGYKPTSCPIKRLYEYISKRNIEDYLEWRNTYGNDRFSVTKYE